MVTGLGRTELSKQELMKLPLFHQLGEVILVDGLVLTTEEERKMETLTEKDGLTQGRSEQKSFSSPHSINGLAAIVILVKTWTRNSTLTLSQVLNGEHCSWILPEKRLPNLKAYLLFK